MIIRRKIFAVLLTAALILTLLPAMAFAEGNIPAEPVKAEFSGVPFGTVGSSEIEGLNTIGTSIEVYYSEESNTPDKVYEYVEYTYTDDTGEKQLISGYLEEGSDPERFENYAFVTPDYDSFDSIKEGENSIQLIMSIPYGEDEYGYINYEDFTQTFYIWGKVDRPVEVEFIPADGFTLKGSVGYNYLDEKLFYGEGNKFAVKIEYKDAPNVTPQVGYYTAEYEYYKSKDGSVEGFYDNGNPEYERFDMTNGMECYLKKGMNRGVELTYYAYVDGEEEPIELPVTVDIYADKYGLYADDSYISTYTGKAIARSNIKFRIYNSNDALVSSKAYTFKKPKYKSMGWHYLKVRIKDEYKDKYNTDTVLVRYGIGPSVPRISGLVLGKSNVAVKWRKLTSKQLKNIDGVCIVLSTDKQFINNRRKITISKKAFKSGRSVIKNLKKIKGYKGYYVKAYSYKYIKQDGRRIKMPSADSKVMFIER